MRIDFNAVKEFSAGLIFLSISAMIGMIGAHEIVKWLDSPAPGVPQDIVVDVARCEVVVPMFVSPKQPAPKKTPVRKPRSPKE